MLLKKIKHWFKSRNVRSLSPLEIAALDKAEAKRQRKNKARMHPIEQTTHETK